MIAATKKNYILKISESLVLRIYFRTDNLFIGKQNFISCALLNEEALLLN